MPFLTILIGVIVVVIVLIVVKSISSKPKATCAICGKEVGLNRLEIGKTINGNPIWECLDCANRGGLINIDHTTGKAWFVDVKDTELRDKCEEIIKVVKPAICAQLKSPASAQIPVDLISIVDDDARGYKVFGFVDSQNSYGAMIRNDFSAEIAIENGVPVVKSSSVAARANAQRAKAFGANYITISIITALGGIILYFIISAMVG